MNKEVISNKQGMSLIILFSIGTSSIHTMGLEAKNDIWLAIILSIFMALLMVLIYARIHYIFPNRGLSDIIEICFGKLIGKVIILLFTWFIFDLAALVLRNIVQFINVVGIPDTPAVIPTIVIITICIFAIKEGIEVLGRWGEFFLTIPIGFIFITIVVLIPDMNINNIKPVLHNGIKPVLRGAFGVLSFPFLDTIAFTMIFNGFKRKESPYKIYICSLLIGGLMVLATSTINLLVLGIDSASNLYYPSHTTGTRIDVGMGIQRVEVIATIIFLLGSFIKVSICLMATCKGVVKIIGCKDYRFIVIPVSLLTINLCYFEFDSVMSYFEWAVDIYPFYAFLFQVILPVIIWIVAEIKKKRLKNEQLREI